MKRVLLVAIFVFAALFSLGSQENESNAKYDDINMLLTLSGSGEMGMMALDALSAQFQQIFPDIPADYWSIFREEVSVEELQALIVPVYDAYFTHEEIKAMISFYRSPVGVKLVEVQPAIAQESMIIGQIWGEEVAERVLNRMEKDGYYQQP